jgi:ferredoxin-NADP reductase
MDWHRARVLKTTQAADDMLSLVVEPAVWKPFKAGQHYEIRLPDTRVSREYSIVSAPHEEGRLEFGIQLMPGGLLSPQLWKLSEGSEVEISGPWGQSFVWESSMRGPMVLIGAGSGITPLLSMYAAYTHACPDEKAVFIMSAKSSPRIMHYDKLKDGLVTRQTATEGRVDTAFLERHTGLFASREGVRMYVCGPDGFIDDIVDMLIELGFPPLCIRSERFT